jgi:hypothetical protein
VKKKAYKTTRWEILKNPLAAWKTACYYHMSGYKSRRDQGQQPLKQNEICRSEH